MVDLRSDTLTLPDRAMLEVILSAKLGDDGRTNSEGRGEDATINALEDLAAKLTGKEEGMLCCSGTMGNTCAILTYCRPGDKVLVDHNQHIYRSEKMVFDPRFGQLTPVFYELGEHHTPVLEDVKRLLGENDIKLMCVENTHNFSGGACTSLKELEAIRKVCEEHHVPVHMDGARLFNAAIAMGVKASEIAQYVDSVMFCISKGLGAPVGSVVCSTHAFIKEARQTRKLLGGTMRQAGVIAAPGIYALEHNIERLKEDHDNAHYVYEHTKDLKKTKVQQDVQSNIVMIFTDETGLTAQEYCDRLKEKGVHIRPVQEGQVRLVFYKGITHEDTVKATEAIRALDAEL